MNRNRILRSLAILLPALLIVGAGTFATFSAQTKNPGNLFANGTLVLSNKVNTGTTCYSTGAGTSVDANNTNTSCDALFNLTLKKPGDSSTSDVTVKNEGSLAASALKLYSGACAAADVTGTYHGTADPCANVQLYIQEYSDAARTTVSACRYGGAVVTNTCDFSDTTKTLAAFATSYPAGTPLGLAAAAAGTSRYFRIGVQEPSSANNTYQGRQAGIDFTWTLDQ